MAQRSADRPGIALLHSPLVGPLCWQPFAELLRAQGYQVIVPDLVAAAAAGWPVQRLIDDHLAILTGPHRVHPALTTLLDAITTPHA